MSLTGLHTALTEDRTFANIFAQASQPLAERSSETIIKGRSLPSLTITSASLTPPPAPGAASVRGIWGISSTLRR